MAGEGESLVSLLAIHNGDLPVEPVLDGRRVPVISSYFEESIDLGEVKTLEANADQVFEGSKNRGEGFFITHAEAATLIGCDLKNAEVVIPILSGGEITEVPDIKPQRCAIFFQDWPESKAAQYAGAFEFLMNRVDAERRSEADSKLGQVWWRFERPRMSLYRKLNRLDCCFAACATAKYLGFVRCPTNHLFTQGAKIFATTRWDLYAVVQSTLHEVWARKYSGALKQDLRYSPSKCFETFAFPEGLWQTANPVLAALGERYHEHRKCLMLGLWIGLTDIYNLFHARDLSPAKVAKVSKKSAEESARGFEGLLQMRRLHCELDLAIRDTYGWQNLPLDHDFHEVETLAENDRLRYTISADARKELLRRLLALNHASAEAEKGAPKATKPRRGKKASAPIDEHVPMFTEED